LGAEELVALNISQPWLRSEVYRVTQNQIHLLEWLLEAYTPQHAHYHHATKHLKNSYTQLQAQFWTSPLDSLAVLSDIHFVLASDALPTELKLMQSHAIHYISTAVHLHTQLDNTVTIKDSGSLINLHSTLFLVESAMIIQESGLVHYYLSSTANVAGSSLLECLNAQRPQEMTIQF
jgi:hypothetical protein